jgi:tripartite-type tricarboxylate transporter receptor subunit TctC
MTSTQASNSSATGKRKKVSLTRRTVLAGICALALAGTGDAIAQPAVFPSRPITLVVPFAAGGGTDAIARLIAQKMGERLGQSVVVENRAGAGGGIANKAVIAAPADGHMILLGTAGTQAVNPSLNTGAGYNPVADLVPIAKVGATPNILVVHPSVAARTVGELIALAKARPGTIPYASSGTGTVSHLSGVLFTRMADISMNHVPYRGAGPANNDLVGGQVQAMFDSPITLLQLVQAGQIRALAVTSETRFAALPDVPTMREAGFPNYVSEVWLGTFAPKATPVPIVEALRTAILEAVRSDEIGTRMRQLGFTPVPGDGTVLAQTLNRDLDRWGTLIRDVGIKPE